MVAIVIITVTMTLGYQLIGKVILTLNTNTQQAERIVQIDRFNRLLLQDLHHAENINLENSNGVLTLTYTSKTTPKEVTFTPTANGLYTLDYAQHGKTTTNWLTIEQSASNLPITFNPSSNQLTFNFSIANIPYTYSFYNRRGNNE